MWPRRADRAGGQWLGSRLTPTSHTWPGSAAGVSGGRCLLNRVKSFCGRPAKTSHPPVQVSAG